MRNSLFILFGLCAVGLGAHGTGLEGFVCPKSQEVKPGLNKKWQTHGRVERTFHAEFPELVRGAPVGVIFSWHGAGDTIESWRSKFPLADYSSRDFPFIVITPHDLGLAPVGVRPGLAWDLFKSELGDDNYEARLFESVLGCLAKSHNISSTHIYSAGFSAGAMVSNMLHTRYPDLVSAIFSASGVWLSDSVQREMIHFPLGMHPAMNWTPISPEKNGAVLMTHGGLTDAYQMWHREILNFNVAAIQTMGYLKYSNRTVVSCEHDSGHRLHPALSTANIVKFFRAHSAGQPSAISTSENLPPSMRTTCSVLTPNWIIE